MCGIAGTTHPTQAASLIRSMTQAMAHRGPDAEGHFVHPERPLALGHRRLSIIDLSEAGSQPFYSACGQYVMVFNGEVFNFQEIATELLNEKSLTFRSRTDTEVILEAFVHWGPNFVHKLNGMFAIAIYDVREDKLFLWRDRLGIKPIYFYHHGRHFAFASELGSLKAAVPFSTINQAAVSLYFHLGYIPAPHTIYSEAKKLPAGHWLTYEKGQIQSGAWWPIEEVSNHAYQGSLEEATEELDQLLTDAVAKRLVADVPFGTFLSGGIDSSLVTALAAKQYGPGLRTFSIAMDQQTHDESSYALAVSKALGTNHTSFKVTANDAMDLVTALPDIYQEPYADSSAMPTLLVSQLARQHVTMVLTGDGGDELFLGYGAYRWAERWNQMPGFLRQTAAFALSIGKERHKRAADLLRGPKNVSTYSHIFSQEQYLFSDRELPALLNFPPQLNSISPLFPERPLSPAEQQAFFDLQYYLPDDLLVKVDRATMRHSLEARVPILDYRVATFAMNLPPHFKMQGDIQKHILKNVLYRYLPASLFDRPKWGFSVPLATWLQKELAPLVDQWVAQPEAYAHGCLQHATALQWLNRFKAGETRLYNRIWLILQFNLWYARNHA